MPDEILAKAGTVTLVVKNMQCTQTTYTNSSQHLDSARFCLVLPGGSESVLWKDRLLKQQAAEIFATAANC